MNSDPNINNNALSSASIPESNDSLYLPSNQELRELEPVLNHIRQMAQACDRDCARLLTILRGLEAVHREIREDLFQPALPDNRQALYALLRDVEAEGGWPYINRMKLQDFLQQLIESETEGNDAQSALNE